MENNDLLYENLKGTKTAINFESKKEFKELFRIIGVNSSPIPFDSNPMVPSLRKNNLLLDCIDKSKSPFPYKTVIIQCKIYAEDNGYKIISAADFIAANKPKDSAQQNNSFMLMPKPDPELLISKLLGTKTGITCYNKVTWDAVKKLLNIHSFLFGYDETNNCILSLNYGMGTTTKVHPASAVAEGYRIIEANDFISANIDLSMRNLFSYTGIFKIGFSIKSGAQIPPAFKIFNDFVTPSPMNFVNHQTWSVGGIIDFMNCLILSPDQAQEQGYFIFPLSRFIEASNNDKRSPFSVPFPENPISNTADNPENENTNVDSKFVPGHEYLIKSEFNILASICKLKFCKRQRPATEFFQ